MKEYIGKKETEIFNVILDELGDRDYVKFKSQKKGYMALNVDNLGNLTLDGEAHKLISMSHNRKQNGDLMADPDMQFAISQQGVVIPITFQNDFTGSYDIAITNGNQINERKAEKLAEFTNIWLNNLNAQQGILEHKYTLTDIENNVIDSKFKAQINTQTKVDFELPVIEKISMSEAVKKTAKTGEYPDFYNDFVEDSKRVYNFGVFAVQNGVTPTQTARFLQQITLVGETNKFKEKIIPAIDRFIAENENSADKFKKIYGVSPDAAKKLFEYEHIDEILKFNYTKQSTFMKSWGEEMQLKLDEKLLGAFLSYWQQNPLTAENIKDFSDTYFHLEAVAMTFGKFDELEKLWQDKYPLWASKEAEEIFRIPKNKDGLTMRADWEQNWKDKILYPKASHFIEVMKKETYTKNLWTDEEIIKDQAKTTKRDLEQTREIANSKFKEWRRELEDFYGIEVSDTNHNENYAEWYHDGLGAIKKLLAEQQGRVVGAFHREDIGDIDIRYKELSKFKIEPEKLADIIQNGKITLKNVENQGYTAVTTIKKDDFVLVLKQYEVGFSKRNFEFDSFIQINKQENTMPSADYTKRQNETNSGAYSKVKNNYNYGNNSNYGNYGKRQNYAKTGQAGFNQTSQNTATQTANAPQGAEQGGYKNRQQYASKSYKSPKSEKTEQPKTTEKPNLYELAKQSSLEVDKSIEILSKQLKDPKTKEAAMEAMTRYLEQFNNLHNYSGRNIMLAMKQGKERGIEVSRLGSYDSWKDLKGTEKDKDGNLKEVSVLKGEKGLSILVPVFKPRFLEQRDLDKNAKNSFALVLDENGQKQPVMQKIKNEKGEIVEVQKQELAYFSLGKVFDISQTNAYEIGAVKKPSKTKVGEFDGQITDFTLQSLAEKITKTYGIEVNFGALSRAARGFYQQHDDGEKEIFIDNRHLSEASQMATLFHELGHAVMNHSYAKDGKEKAEVQAEAFAFVLSRKFGLETTSAEFISAYIANVENSDEFFKLVEPVRKEVAKAYEKLDLQSEFDKLVAGKEAYEENGKFKEEAEVERIAQGKLYSFETNFDNIDPDDDSAMNEIREKAKQEQAKEQEKDSHNSHNKQRDKNRP